MRSASVTYPVASTKALNSAFVTVVALIRKGLMRVLRKGASPSFAIPASAVPNRPVPPATAMAAALYLSKACWLVLICSADV